MTLIQGLNIKIKSLIALAAFAPTMVLAQTNIPSSGVSSTGKPAGMPPTPTPQAVTNTVKTVETVNSSKPVAPPLNPSQSSILKDGGSTGKSGSVEMKK
jgi:hypothetical protein